MELTFVHQYSGDAPKRRRLAKACESCRARKKRCVHFADDPDADAGDNDDNSLKENGLPERTPDGATTEPSPDVVDVPTSHSSTSPSSGDMNNHNWRRFISDLAPESLFLNRSKPVKRDDQARPEDIGVWVEPREWDALVRQREVAAHASNVSRQRPHVSVLEALIDIYFRKIHPLLPLLDEGHFRREYRDGSVTEPLVHALCLMAAKDTEAVQHLRMSPSSTLLSPRDFCGRLYDSVKQALKSTYRFDKITLIRILALASLHHESPDGAEEASMYLSQAMHHAQTIGLHLGRDADANSLQELTMKRLFWCLYAMDRMNATMNGRPLVMADMDIAIDPVTSGETGFPAFEAWLRITELLNKILGFYRPHVPLDVTGWEDVFTDYEHIIDQVHGWHLGKSMLATLHLYYLCVAILSHRCRGIKQIQRGTPSSNRQRLCASEVVRFMQSEHCKDVLPLPIIPYAVSLALSVSYQHLRQSQLAHQQDDARNDFRACTRILQTLRRTWCSVDAIVVLARRALGELDRTPDLAVFRLPRQGQSPPPPPSRPAHNSSVQVLDAAVKPVSACPEMDHVSQAEKERRRQQAEKEELEQSASLLQQYQAGAELFDGMDDVFGTYLDPNYPVHLDDLSFLDDERLI